MLDTIENAQTGISAVAGHQDDFNTLVIYFIIIQSQQFLYQLKSLTGLQKIVFPADLVFRLGFKPL